MLVVSYISVTYKRLYNAYTLTEMLKLPALSSNLSPQFDVQLIEISGGSVSDRFCLVNRPPTVSTTVLSFDNSRLSCEIVNSIYMLEFYKEHLILLL